MTSTSTIAKYGFIGSLGLLIMGWAAQTYLWHGYQLANPAVGEISTTPGFTLITAGLFVIGTVIAFTAFSEGLAQALGTDR